jgi:hypothetical protein
MAPTTAFTGPADLVTATVLAVVVGGYVLRLTGRPTPASPAPGPPAEPVTLRTAWPWVALAFATLAWELANYASSARSTHPTLSSLADQLTGSPLGRAVCCFAFVAAGWWLARR